MIDGWVTKPLSIMYMGLLLLYTCTVVVCILLCELLRVHTSTSLWIPLAEPAIECGHTHDLALSTVGIYTRKGCLLGAYTATCRQATIRRLGCTTKKCISVATLVVLLTMVFVVSKATVSLCFFVAHVRKANMYFEVNVYHNVYTASM